MVGRSVKLASLRKLRVELDKVKVVVGGVEVGGDYVAGLVQRHQFPGWQFNILT